MAQRRQSTPQSSDTDRSQDRAWTEDASGRDITNDEIASRAYEIYEQRGAEHGHDWDDWLQAERELQKRRGTPGPTPS